jgi:hypothetical protein
MNELNNLDIINNYLYFYNKINEFDEKLYLKIKNEFLCYFFK